MHRSTWPLIALAISLLVAGLLASTQLRPAPAQPAALPAPTGPMRARAPQTTCAEGQDATGAQIKLALRADARDAATLSLTYADQPAQIAELLRNGTSFKGTLAERPISLRLGQSGFQLAWADVQAALRTTPCPQ